MKVLIVDDTTFMRFTLRQILEQNNIEVVGEAQDGLAAVKAYKALKPDIVTMDITMPELDGIGAVKEIRSFDPKAKIVMVSALGQEKYIKDAILSGASGFVVKPFKPEKILDELNKLGNK